MTVSFFVNMEPLSLKIARENIDMMVDDLADSEVVEYLDNEKVVNNLKYGFIALTTIVSFVESFLNTILRDCINIKHNSEELKKDIVSKIDYICDFYGISKSTIKGDQIFASFRKLSKIRGGLIHYKINWNSEGLGVIDFDIPENEKFKNYFTKYSFERELENAKKLCMNIAAKTGLSINALAGTIECNARDGLASYVFDERRINIDPARNIIPNSRMKK